MNEDERLVETDRWLRYAREDLAAAVAIAEGKNIPARHACWLAQQAAEKAIKAVLVFLQIDFPRRHDLDALRNLVPDGWQVRVEQLSLAALTEWAVEARYPGDWADATEADAQVAVRDAREVWNLVRADFARHGLSVEDVTR